MGKYTCLYISEIPRRDQKDADPGISVYRLDESSEKLSFLDKFSLHGITNVSCVDAERGLLYFTGEEPDKKRQRSCGDRVIVMQADLKTGLLTRIVQCVPTLSPNPVYVSLDKEKYHMVVANHTTHNAVYKVERDADGNWTTRAVFDDSTVVLYSLNEDGTVRRAEDVVTQDGSGPLRTQTHAHPHCAVFTPDGKMFAVCDKGADKVFLYSITDDRLRLLHEPWNSRAGDEPRFCAFHPTQNYLYVNHEGNLGLDVLHYTENGKLQHIQTILSEPAGLVHEQGVIYEHQGIAIHPSGKWLYSVARGADAIAAYRIDADSGKLEEIELYPICGAWPRCCQLTPDGNWLIAGTRDGGELILYRIAEDGSLTETDRVKHSCGVAYISALQINAGADAC